MMEGILHRTVTVNGINMHIAEKGDGPLVLLIHGFPELWYCWRHQILGLAARGYRAVAPDMRGYGDTDAPPSASSYTAFHIVGDLVALIDALGQDQVPSQSKPHDQSERPRSFICLDCRDLHPEYSCSRLIIGLELDGCKNEWYCAPHIKIDHQ